MTNNDFSVYLTGFYQTTEGKKWQEELTAKLSRHSGTRKDSILRRALMSLKNEWEDKRLYSMLGLDGSPHKGERKQIDPDVLDRILNEGTITKC